ncbi:dnaJ homolog subfamily C member 30, mitochondrial [Galendromus occidentalis]|uniref:DnaJ homolog subfamily C member 30, mitochondrial n=1 Tax=Galendromus occidentalis TaxID=34638 RepID=A0AAJ6QQX7_9ACAR|nr:dnaJ homolog subfamily C member 30, mitochondrial [Galendromus occidentalis]
MLRRCRSLTGNSGASTDSPGTYRFIRLLSLNASSKRTHYDCLELPLSATSKEIKSAFYRLSMKHHPDKNLDKEDSAEKFRRVSEAYRVLSNEETKRLYDAELRNTSASPASFGGSPVRKPSMRGAHVSARPPPPMGRSKIYNFDEFYRQHYGQDAREMNEQRQSRAREEEELGEETGRRGLILTVLTFMILLAAKDLD